MGNRFILSLLYLSWQYFTLPHTFRADLSRMVGIQPNSDLIPSEKIKKFKLRFLATPSFSESFRAESELKKDVFLDHFLPYSDHIPTSFRPHSSHILTKFRPHSNQNLTKFLCLVSIFICVIFFSFTIIIIILINTLQKQFNILKKKIT